MGTYSAESVAVVHVRWFGFEGGGEGWWAEKFARSEDVSSVFDFSNSGRRMTEGPPDMIFLVSLDLIVDKHGVVVRGREYELHGSGFYGAGRLVKKMVYLSLSPRILWWYRVRRALKGRLQCTLCLSASGASFKKRLRRGRYSAAE